MNRTEKLHRESRYFAFITALLLIAFIAIGCWVPMAHLSAQSLGGGFWVKSVMGALCLCLLTVAYATGRESLRLRRLARQSSKWDQIRAIRPRL